MAEQKTPNAQRPTLNGGKSGLSVPHDCGAAGKTLNVISLGAGVQSSAMALMAAGGELTPMPIAAIFADTGDEPASVYRWLDWLEKELPFPVHRVSAGMLSKAATRLRISGETGNGYVKPGLPVFFTGGSGMGSRQCTLDYKITPIIRKLAAMRKEGKAEKMIQWIGISSDEKRRMKPARVSYVENVWPLVEKNISRRGCLEWMSAHGFAVPPRSSCRYCPFHSDDEWRKLKREQPEEFEKAAVFEDELQETYKGVTKCDGTPFLHRSCVPLRQVDLSTDVERGQGVLWPLECEGMCGV